MSTRLGTEHGQAKQRRHGPLRVLEMPSQVCSLLITLFWWLNSMKRYFLHLFYCFVTFCFMLCTSTLHCVAEGACVPNRMLPKLIDMQNGIPFLLELRLPLDSHLSQDPYDVSMFILMSSSPFPINKTSLKAEIH